jgi:hypothetical protein
VELSFDDIGGSGADERPEDRLRREPGFQELLRLSGGEVLEVRREG